MRLKHFWLALIAIGASGAAHAAMECKFNDGNTRTIMPGMSTMIVPLPPGTISVPTQISPTILLEFDTPLQSSCNVGNDGESVWQMTDNALLWGNVNGHATFRTNVEGIYYTLAIYPDANTVTAWFPPQAGSYYETGDANNDEGVVNARYWHARMDIYQDPTFKGLPTNVVFLTAAGGMLGHAVIGDPHTGTESDHPRVPININDMSFQLPLHAPSCVLRAPTTVDLGDWYRSDLENDNTTEVSFKIEGSCANVIEVDAKVVSEHTTSDGALFTNSITSNSSVTAAKGVGVKLRTPAYSQIHNNQSETIAAGNPIGAPVYQVSATYNAKLVKTNTEAVTPGVFGTTITFQVTYQ
ncbi:fimbrial protein StkG [Salmonella enterica subsp. enterica serovar Ituri]|nr:fimbrial protein StkG [Salmonella enterica subsp. enterica serovar Ituri]